MHMQIQELNTVNFFTSDALKNCGEKLVYFGKRTSNYGIGMCVQLRISPTFDKSYSVSILQLR